MKNTVTVNAEQSLYVIDCGSGYTCFGFENARREANFIAQELTELEFNGLSKNSEVIAELASKKPYFVQPDEFGTLVAYEKWRAAVQQFSLSALSKRTYWGPGVDRKLRAVLNRYFGTGDGIRLFVGDPETGVDWMEENDVLGRVGRSTGTMKIPLLVPKGESCGGAILLKNVLRILDAESGEEVYVHPKYQAPKLSMERSTKEGYEWDVLVGGKTHASFKTLGKAAGWVAFMSGESIYQGAAAYV